MTRNVFKETTFLSDRTGNCKTKWPIAVTYERMNQMRLCVSARDNRQRACADMEQRD